MNDKTYSEADMGYVRNVVAMIADALVQATELPKQMSQIKADMDSLSHNLETTKARNVELDNLLNDTRRQRDEAEQALSQAKAELSQTASQRDYANEQAQKFQADLARVQDELTKAKSERDDYGLKQMEAEDRAKAAEAKLDKLREAMGLPKAEPEKPQPAPQPIVPYTQETNPAPIPPKHIYEGEPGYDYKKGERWDSNKQKYYIETSDEIPF